MLRLFGNHKLDKRERLVSQILFYCDAETLNQAAAINDTWRNAIKAMYTRKSLHADILARCDFFTHVQFCDFKIYSLSNGLTNNTYRIKIHGQSYVARLPGKNSNAYINRAAEYVNAHIAAELGANARIIYFNPLVGTQVTEFLPNAVELSPQSMQETANMQAAVKVLQAVHQSNKAFLNNVDVFDRNRQMLGLLTQMNHPIVDEYQKLIHELQIVETFFVTLKPAKTPCHVDTTPSNFLFSKNKLRLIDWEYSGNNYPLWDLVALSVESDFNHAQVKELLTHYYGCVSENILNQFYALEPIYELWGALWASVQLASDNIIDKRDNLIQMESVRKTNCRSTVNSIAYKQLLQKLESMMVEPENSDRQLLRK